MNNQQPTYSLRPIFSVRCMGGWMGAWARDRLTLQRAGCARSLADKPRAHQTIPSSAIFGCGPTGR